VHPILLSPKPCANGDKTGSPNGTRSLANASNRRIGSRKNFSPSTNLIAILRQRIGKLARVQARVSKRVGATTPICGNPNSIALGEIRFVGGRQGGGSEKGGEQHQRRWLHQPLVSAIRNGSGSSQCPEVGAFGRSRASRKGTAGEKASAFSESMVFQESKLARTASRKGSVDRRHSAQAYVEPTAKLQLPARVSCGPASLFLRARSVPLTASLV
jgi:hypothetical protein